VSHPAWVWIAVHSIQLKIFNTHTELGSEPVPFSERFLVAHLPLWLSICS